MSDGSFTQDEIDELLLSTQSKNKPETLNILGQDYIYQENNEKGDTRLEDTDGYHDGYAKIICVNNDYNENHSLAIRNFTEYKKKVIRHEIIHAFFTESGLKNYGEDEVIVDWIAAQFPKLLKAFAQVEAL